MSRLLGTAVLAAALLAEYAPVSAQQEKVPFDILQQESLDMTPSAAR